VAAPYTLWRERPDAAAPFIVCAMFTLDYRQMAERLAASLDRFAQPHALFEVAQVHRSISAKGGGDLDFSKPLFIAAMLARFAKPVLYVDSNMVFREQPDLIAQLCDQGCDFAIYNWLPDPLNDAWKLDAAGRWRFSLSIDVASDSQLMASGAVQLWRGTAASQALLADWKHRLVEFPGAQDDQCLDMAFNHGRLEGLHPHWLPKAYCRYAFWPYVRPVIDHPEFPAPDDGHWTDLGIVRLDRGKIRRVQKQPPFPRDAIFEPGQMGPDLVRPKPRPD
jgi:hypothetical protein